MTGIVINADGTRREVSPRNKTDFQLDELQGIVEGYIEIVRLGRTRCMVVNEEGHILRKPYTHLATLVAYESGVMDVIVGNVLVCDINMIK